MHPDLRSAWLGVVLTALPWQGVVAQEAGDPRFVRAFGKLYTTSQLGGLVKDWCDARAPATGEVTTTALAAWRSAHRLDDIEARAETVLGSQVASIVAAVQARRASVFSSLDKDSKDPDADCRQMLAYLNRSADPKRVNPFEYRLVESQRARMAAAPVITVPAESAAGSSGTAVVPFSRGSGTVYSVAQLSALVAQDPRTAAARLRQLGAITVRGTLERYDESRPNETVWLNTIADGWRSRSSVLCYDQGHTFARLYEANRRAVTVRGSVRKVGSWIELEDCQFVADGTGLTASSMSDAAGLERIAVKPEQVRTAPDGGVAMVDIEGIYQPSKLRYNAMTMLFEPDETTYLVLKDGWVYDSLVVSPHDLDVAESRRLEPQHWHRWRRRGATMEIQRYDERGQTDGQWSELAVVARPPVGPRRLDGTFLAVSSATVGTAFSMGQTSYTFRPDGTFSWVNFTQGFASSPSGTGPDGVSIVVGGASVGPGGTSVSSVGGGEDEGTYVTDGYTLELRTRSGKVHRFPIFPWDNGKYRDHLVINGTTYSPPK